MARENLNAKFYIEGLKLSGIVDKRFLDPVTAPQKIRKITNYS